MVPADLAGRDGPLFAEPPDRARAGALMGGHLMVGAVLYANERTILLIDRTLFVAPAGMHLPSFRPGATLVIEYERLEGCNVLTHVPEVRE